MLRGVPGGLVIAQSPRAGWRLRTTLLQKAGGPLKLDGWVQADVRDGTPGIVCGVLNDNGSAYDVLFLVFPTAVGWAWDDYVAWDPESSVERERIP